MRSCRYGSVRRLLVGALAMTAAVASAINFVVVPSALAPAAAAASSQPLSYHGGNVMLTTTNHLIFWLPPTLQDGSSAQAPSDYVSTIEQFFRDEGGTSLYNTYTQYCQGVASGSTSCPAGSNAIQNNATYGGAVITTQPYPLHDCQVAQFIGPGNCVQDTTIQNLIQAAIGSTGWSTGLNQAFYVFLAPGEASCKLADCIGGSGCSAEHDFFHTGPLGTGPEVIYAKIPGETCQLPPGPHDPATDVAITFASHEQAEMVTNPDGGGWWGSSGNTDEIGDRCQGTGAFQHWNGHTYLVQQEWSNTSNACVAGEPNHEIKPTTASAIDLNRPACTANTLAANDDSSTGSVTLPFTLNFYGTSYSSLYVNNNGNVTFDAPLPTFTPFGLTATQTPIIAPFFADVDTRGPGSGVVTYGGAPAQGGNPAYFCVDWLNVGYYNAHTDKTNSFQLLLIDRSAQTGTAGDFDIVFNYDDVLWETGDASGGAGGLGGTSARVGYSNGTSRSAEVFGSGVNGALLDGGPEALTSSSQNSTTPGQFIFPVRNGNTTGGGFEGTVTDSSNPPVPVSGSVLQFCTAGSASQSCGIASTTPLGNYSVTGLPAGNYDVRVSPPAGSSLFERDLGPIALADQATVRLDVALSGPRGLTPGTTITSLHTNPDGTPVLDWKTANTLTTHGCAGGAASYTITIANNQHGNPVSGAMTETPAGSGTYLATIPPLSPQYGPAQVDISITCPDPAQNQTTSFNVYIDPSGSVVDQFGHPISGATVTLFRADAASGPYTQVPAGSSIMSPANRLNPDTTTATGRFGWDVLQGYYEIRASKDGCAAPGNPSQPFVQSPVLQIPPPAADLVLTLQCSQPTTSTLTSSPNPSRYGQSVTLVDTVTAASGTPFGSVTFYDGPTSLGTATLNAAGIATLTTTKLSVGNHSVTAVYAGSGSFLGSTSNTIGQIVNYTSCVTGSQNGGLSVGAGQAICVTSSGRVHGTATVRSGGLLYVNGGTVDGGITVQSGGALFINAGTINGGVTSTAATALSVCGARLTNGGVSALGSVGFVVIGDGGDDNNPGCAGSTINGNITLGSNLAGVEVGGDTVNGTVTLTSNSGAGPNAENVKPEVEANHVNGGLTCTNNSPAPIDDGRPNTVSGSRTGQCSAAGF